MRNCHCVITLLFFVFFNGSLTGGLIKSGHQNIISTIQCHPNALCLKYNIYAVSTVNEIRKQKCQETDIKNAELHKLQGQP